MAIVDGFLTSPTTKVKLRWLKLEQFKFNQSGVNMSDQDTKTISKLIIEFTLNKNKKKSKSRDSRFTRETYNKKRYRKNRTTLSRTRKNI
ncbi:hypothetical protein [Rickettsia felis]|uniref:hypothetical protein n=1 Tax=Rickettsia felis TaxID=42862 RepID=UPI000AE710B3|nr:hypothetical protein [Rickettsia felis]